MNMTEMNREWINYLDEIGHNTQAHYSEHERDGFPELFKEANLLENSLYTREQCPMLIVKSEVLGVDIYVLATAVVKAGKRYSILSSLLGSYRQLGQMTLEGLKDNPELWDEALDGLKSKLSEDIVKYDNLF